MGGHIRSELVLVVSGPVASGQNGSETEKFSFWKNDGSTGLETVSVPTSSNQSYAMQVTAIFSP
jgi:hypothetical protein